jgi:tetratricopeptide (TPR) repeat protein
LFYVVNLLLVLQIISIGLTIVSERYTYVPYIGLAFMFATLVSRSKIIPQKVSVAVASIFVVVMGVVTFQRTKVWKNSGTLWTDVLKTYPRTPYARTNRANYLSKLPLRPEHKAHADSIYKIAFEDCAIALAERSNHAPAFEYRGLMYLDRQQIKEAFADANELIRLKPDYRIGYDIRATAFYKMNEPAKALADYTRCIEIKPDDHRSYNNRGAVYMNSFQKYNEALSEFTKAIEISPLGNYYLNRSVCYFRMGNITKAREEASIAAQRGAVIPDSFKALLQSK